MTDGPPIPGPPTADEEIRWRAAKQLRRERPEWLVIWVTMTQRFHAYPLTGRRTGVTLTGTDTSELAAKIDQDQARRARVRGRSDPRSIIERWENP